jgi:hypothetical protein
MMTSTSADSLAPQGRTAFCLSRIIRKAAWIVEYGLPATGGGQRLIASNKPVSQKPALLPLQ